MLRLLDQYRILIDIGPVQMSVLAEKNGKPLGREFHALEEVITDWLKDLKRCLGTAKKPWPLISNPQGFPRVLKKMYEAVEKSQEENLTPMAAVAGTISELSAEYLAERGATKVLVNNGGDIAVYLKRGEKTKVGVVPRLGAEPTHYIDLNAGSGIGGIATSGRGGRSFTLGIADASVAVAASASVADACATCLGNAVNLESALIKRKLAGQIDPGSDIAELMVTVEVGSLTRELRLKALERGIEKARKLVDSKILMGAVLFLQGEMRQYPEDIVQPIKLN